MAKAEKMKKVRHDKALRIRYEGKVWIVDAAEWRTPDGSRGELRVYRIEGDVTTPLLGEALQAEAESRTLSLIAA
jgi:hypothetical protein